VSDCKHCKNGWLENRFGEDVECVNGILIDIDVYTEGWPRDEAFPVAPCHPRWADQCAERDFPDDSQDRLLSAAGLDQ
jgi:hypothetical protein